ncbi:MAG: hypothetical protein FJX59_18975 [Alphaproteobacteria bacterium]|nr:hypothetical protein [Alphaproteobacteria bacterium]
MIRIAIAAVAATLLSAPTVAADKVLKVAIGFVSAKRGNPYEGISIPPVLPHHAVFDTLTTLDKKGQVAPALALSWTAEAPDRWVFRLRSGVSYTNGEPFNVDALIASAEHMATPKGRAETIGSQMSQVARVERIDDLTARVHLSEPDGLFPLHAASWRVPAPKAYAELPRDQFDAAPVGTGPFRVTAWEAGKVIMVANRQSWRAPKLDGLEIVEAPDETSRLQTFLSRASMLVMGVAPDNRAEIEAVGGVMFTRKTLMVHFYGFHTTQDTPDRDTPIRDTPIKDPRVRLALNLGVDRESIIKTVLLGTTTPASQLALPGTFGYADALKPYPYDPERAKKLLAEAGYPNGLTLTLGLTAGLRPSDTLNAQQAAADLAKIGVNLEILTRPQQKQQLDMFTGKLDVDLFTMFTRSVDAMADYRHRSCLRPVLARMPFHCDPAIVDVAKRATAETDLEKRAALYRQVAELEYESPAGIVQWQGAEFDALSPKITGYDPAYDLMRLDEIDLRP